MKKTLICNSLKVSELSSKDIDAMFNLFCKYYSNVSKEQFNIDLSEKDYLFLLKDKATLAIKGFSTIVEFNIDKNGKASRGYFSGDTVIDKEYWGQGALGKAFLKFLFIQKLKKPFTPLYWFLISKGYKTYLMMANNFKTHYPRFEKETPSHLREIINTFSEELYGDSYNREIGIISFSKQEQNMKDCLKSDVTPISEELMNSNSRINFFAAKNPNWLVGDELSCLAEMTFSMPFYYQYKLIKKLLRGKKNKLSTLDIKTPLQEVK